MNEIDQNKRMTFFLALHLRLRRKTCMFLYFLKPLLLDFGARRNISTLSWTIILFRNFYTNFSNLLWSRSYKKKNLKPFLPWEKTAHYWSKMKQRRMWMPIIKSVEWSDPEVFNKNFPKCVNLRSSIKISFHAKTLSFKLI